MDAVSFLNCVPAIYKANVEMGKPVVPMIIGPIGHGKTELAKQVATTLTRLTGTSYTAHIAQPMLEPFDDIRGMGIPQRTSDGTLIAQYTYPHILPPKEILHNSVWMLDEFTKAQEDSTLALGNSFLQRRLGDTEIPASTFIMCSGNRAGVDKSKDQTLPGHVVARLLMVEWRGSFRSWQPWAMANSVHPITVAFAAQQEAKVFGGAEPKRNEAFLSPRELTTADALIRAWIDYEGRADDSNYYPVTDRDLIQLVAGKIGEGAAEDLKAYALVGKEMPTWEDIMRRPKTAKVPEINSRLGAPALYAVAMMISSKMDTKSVPAVIEYIKRMPQEFQVPVSIKLGIDFPGEAAAAGYIDILMGSSDLMSAAMIYQSSK